MPDIYNTAVAATTVPIGFAQEKPIYEDIAKMPCALLDDYKAYQEGSKQYLGHKMKRGSYYVDLNFLARNKEEQRNFYGFYNDKLNSGLYPFVITLPLFGFDSQFIVTFETDLDTTYENNIDVITLVTKLQIWEMYGNAIYILEAQKGKCIGDCTATSVFVVYTKAVDRYEWSTTKGIIVEGQNTDKITIEMDSDIPPTEVINFEVTCTTYIGDIVQSTLTIPYTQDRVYGIPVADAGNAQTDIIEGATVQLDGSGSYDTTIPTPLPLTYEWFFRDKPETSTAVLDDNTIVNPTFVADGFNSRFILGLSVSNNNNKTSEISYVTIRTEVEILKPIADAGSNITDIPLDTQIALDGSNSYDTNMPSLPLTYQWTLISSPAGSTATIVSPTSSITSIELDVQGHYELSLVVDNGILSSDTVIKTIDSLSVEAWNLNGISIVNSFNLSDLGDDWGPCSALTFKPDGTKMFAHSSALDSSYWAMELLTPWDITTAQERIEQKKLLNGEDLLFSPDGLWAARIRYIDEGRVVSNDLANSYDLSSAIGNYTYDTFNDCTEETCINQSRNLLMNIQYNNDGTKLFVSQYGYNVFIYDLTTPYKSDTMILNSVWSMSDGSILYNLVFKPDGTKVFFISSDGAFKQANLLTPWDLNTIEVDQIDYFVDVDIGYASQMYIDPNGEMLFIVHRNTAVIYKFSLI